MPDDLLGKGPGKRKGVVAEEFDDLGEEMNPWFDSSLFPVGDSALIHPDLLSDLGLEEAEIEPALAEVVTYRNKLSWIGLERWLGCFEM